MRLAAAHKFAAATIQLEAVVMLWLASTARMLQNLSHISVTEYQGSGKAPTEASNQNGWIHSLGSHAAREGKADLVIEQVLTCQILATQLRRAGFGRALFRRVAISAAGRRCCLFQLAGLLTLGRVGRGTLAGGARPGVRVFGP